MKKAIYASLLICIMMGMSGIMNISLAGGETWTQTTDSDFTSGSFDNVEVVGTGDDAVAAEVDRTRGSRTVA